MEPPTHSRVDRAPRTPEDASLPRGTGLADRVRAALLDSENQIIGVSRSWRDSGSPDRCGAGLPIGSDYAASLCDAEVGRALLSAIDTVRGGNAESVTRTPVPPADRGTASRFVAVVRRPPDGPAGSVLVEVIEEGQPADGGLGKQLRWVDELSRALQGGLDLERTLGGALDAVRRALECERAWLLTPCDPSAATWSVPIESAAEGFPGAAAQGGDRPQSDLTRAIFRESLAADGPLAHGPDRTAPGDPSVWQDFAVQSRAGIALHPGSFPRWMLGVHQCTYARLWTPEELALLSVMAQRITAALTAVLLHRDLARSEERHRELFENLNDGAYRCTKEGTLVEANPAFVRMLRFESRHELVGQDIRSLLHGDNATAFPLEGGELAACQLVGRDGAEVWVEGRVRLVQQRRGDPTYSEGILRDVTARRRIERALRESEAQLRQAQKMEAIGRLAGGVAHDFNNLLVAITGFGNLLLDRLDDDDPLRRYAFQIDRAAQRAATLTGQLLAFSRKQILRPTVLDLNRVVDEVRRMLDRTIGEDIEAVTIQDRSLWCVMADRGQVEQVLLNLAVNARAAMPDGGRLTIVTRNVVLDAEAAARLPDAEPGEYAGLVVKDTGFGMDRETLRRSFEPFFTTKDSGKGTGLGLSTVYGIVTQSGGTIRVDTEPGEGASFEVLLPRTPELEERGPDPGEITEELAGTATVLLVEDEAVVRALVREVLEEYGYIVIEAGSGHEALLHCERESGNIDLLVTDVVMPRMGGRELAAEVLRVRPDVKVLYISGYAPWAEDAASDVHFLAKPFTPSALARAVRKILRPS